MPRNAARVANRLPPCPRPAEAHGDVARLAGAAHPEERGLAAGIGAGVDARRDLSRAIRCNYHMTGISTGCRLLSYKWRSTAQAPVKTPQRRGTKMKQTAGVFARRLTSHRFPSLMPRVAGAQRAAMLTILCMMAIA